jgi:hypothetical protein
MLILNSVYRFLFIISLFIVSYFTRPGEIPVEEGPGSFELRSGNLIAGMLGMFFLPAFGVSLLALYHTLRKDPSRWTVRSARYLAYVLAGSAHLLAFHMGQWCAVFLPVAIPSDPYESLAIRMISSGLGLFFLAATLPALFSFLKAGRHGSEADAAGVG